MASQLDPYIAWLDLPPGPQPYGPYELLAVPLFTSNPQTIEAAARRQLDLLRRRAPVECLADSRRMIGEILGARALLLDSERKAAYDRGLRSRLMAAAAVASLEPEPWDVDDRQERETLTLPSRPGGARARHEDRPAEVPTAVSQSAMPGHVSQAFADEPAAGRSAIWRQKLVAAAGLLLFAVVLVFGVFFAIRPSMSEKASAAGRTAESGDELNRPVAAPRSGSDLVSVPPPVIPDHRPGRVKVADAAVPPEPVEPERDNEHAAVAVIPQPAGPNAVAVDGPPEWPVAEAERPVLPLVGNPYRAALPALSAADRAAFVEHLKALLSAGFGSGREGLAEARSHFEAAGRLASDDPRPSYAYGLVLWKRLKFDDAQQQFAAAVSARGASFWPAWQASIWLTLARNDLAGGLQQAVELARRLEAVLPQSANAAVEELTALWLGRVVGYLELPDNELTRDVEAVVGCHRQIRDLLGPVLRRRYDQGRVALVDDYLKVSQGAEQTLAELAVAQAEAADKTQSQIIEEREKRNDRAEQVQMTAEKWKAWIDEQIKEYDARLTPLADEFSGLAAQADGLSVSISRLNLEIIQIEQWLAEPDDQGANQLRLQQIYADKTVLRNQLQVQYAALDRQAAEVRRRALDVERQRQADIAKYQKATGQLIAESGALQKWKKLLDRKESNLGKSRNTSSPQARSIMRQVNAFGTYVPLDPASERARLLDALAADLEAAEAALP